MTPVFIGYGFENPGLAGPVCSARGQYHAGSAGWRARYTCNFISPDEYREHFEFDPDGKGFQTYVMGRYLRDRPADSPARP